MSILSNLKLKLIAEVKPHPKLEPQKKSNPKAIWDDEEVGDMDEIEDDPSDVRPRPRYAILYYRSKM